MTAEDLRSIAAVKVGTAILVGGQRVVIKRVAGGLGVWSVDDMRMVFGGLGDNARSLRACRCYLVMLADPTANDPALPIGCPRCGGEARAILRNLFDAPPERYDIECPCGCRDTMELDERAEVELVDDEEW